MSAHSKSHLTNYQERFFDADQVFDKKKNAFGIGRQFHEGNLKLSWRWNRCSDAQAERKIPFRKSHIADGVDKGEIIEQVRNIFVY